MAQPSQEGPGTGDILPDTGRILAVDPGEKRIGLAISDPSQTLAQPLLTLRRRPGKRFPLRDLKTILDEHSPVGILVGLPISPDGTEARPASEARDTGALIRAKTRLPVHFWDERMTTARARSAIRDLKGRTRGRKQDVDKLAATVLLQTYLDNRLCARAG